MDKTIFQPVTVVDGESDVDSDPLHISSQSSFIKFYNAYYHAVKVDTEPHCHHISTIIILSTPAQQFHGGNIINPQNSALTTNHHHSH